MEACTKAHNGFNAAVKADNLSKARRKLVRMLGAINRMTIIGAKNHGVTSLPHSTGEMLTTARKFNRAKMAKAKSKLR
jgi:hypothetical protein